MKKYRFCFIAALIFLLTSCGNFFNHKKIEFGEFEISGRVDSSVLNNSVQNDFIFDNSRTAFASLEELPSTLHYEVVAKCGDETYSERYEKDSSTVNFDYRMKIHTAGIWEIQAFVYNDAEHTNKIFESKKETVELTENKPYAEVNLVAKPFISSESGMEGSVGLPIKISTTKYTVSSVFAKCISSNSGDWTEPENILNTNIVNLASQKAGIYDINFTFYDSNNNLLFSCVQTINVYSNWKTDTWVCNGDESYLKADSSDGNKIKLTVTDELIKDFLDSTIYVDSNSTSDVEDGTWINPVKTWNGIINKIDFIKTTHPKINIYVKQGSEVTVSDKTQFSSLDNSFEFSFESYKDRPGDKEGNAIIKLDTDDSHIMLDNSAVVSFNGFTFQNFNCKDSVISIEHDYSKLNVINCVFENKNDSKVIFAVIAVYTGNLYIQDVTITGFNLSAGASPYGTGAAIYCLKDINISGNCQIYGNEYDGIYLAWDEDVDRNTLLNVKGSLAGSKIDISSITTPNNEVEIFTNGYGNFNDVPPSTYFTNIVGKNSSDLNYGVAWDPTKSEAAFVSTSGSVTTLMSEKISIGLKSKWATKDGIRLEITKGKNDLKYLDQSERFVSVDYKIKKGSKIVKEAGISTNYPTDGSGLNIEFANAFENFEPGLYSVSVLFSKIGQYTVGYSTEFDVYVTPNTDVVPFEIFLEERDQIPVGGKKIGIFTKKDLENIRDIVNTGYIREDGTQQEASNLKDVEITLYADIDLGGSETNKWRSIGIYDRLTPANRKPFGGIFDGNNHKITGFYGEVGGDSKPEGQYSGLFGYLSANGIVKNLTIYGEFGDAAFVGHNLGKIENCTNYATVASTKNTPYAGSFSCISYGKIKNCINYADLTMPGNYTYLGGIAAQCVDQNPGAVVENCINYGRITAYKDAAGIVCQAYCDVSDCVNYADITTTDVSNSGGKGKACGIASYGKNNIYRCKNYGEISGYDNCAGIVGKIEATIEKTIVIDDCKNYGNVISQNYDKANTDGRVGGIAGTTGTDNTVTFINCINAGDVKAAFCSAGILGCGVQTIKNCINTGTITAKRENHSSGIASWGKSIENCLNLGTVIHIGGGSSVGGIVGDPNPLDVIKNNYYYPSVYIYYGLETQENLYGIKKSIYENNGNSETGHTDRIYRNYDSLTNSTTLETSEPLTVGTVTSNDVIKLMNAWIDAQANKNDYTKWAYDELGNLTPNVSVSGYSELKAVLQNVSAGETISVNLTDTCNITTEFVTGGDVDKFMVIPAGVTLVLDSADHKTVSFDSDKSYASVGILIKGTLVLNDVKLTSSSIHFGAQGAIYVSNSGTFIMNEKAEIDNLKISGRASGAPIIISNGGTFIMNGGIINNCSGRQDGGAIKVKSNGKFVMNGGTICNNIDTGAGTEYPYTGLGGGVNVSSYGTFIMNGGSIVNNTCGTPGYTSGTRGGGVYVASNGTFVEAPDAIISGNTAETGNKYFVTKDAYYGTSENNISKLGEDRFVN